MIGSHGCKLNLELDPHLILMAVASDILLHLQPKMSLTYVRSVVQNVEICLLPISSCISSRQIMYVFAHTSDMHFNKSKYYQTLFSSV